MLISERNSALGGVEIASSLKRQTSLKYLLVLGSLIGRRKRTANRTYSSCLGVGGRGARGQTFEKSFHGCGLRRVVFDVNVTRGVYYIFIYIYIL